MVEQLLAEATADRLIRPSLLSQALEEFGYPGANPVLDCGARLIVSEQGYAVAPVIRRPRSTDVDTGVVTSNQLAAQLLGVESSVSSPYLYFFITRYCPSVIEQIS
ncbi:hypothetical protein V3C99_017819 [Haemonchus contortus]